MPLSLSIHVGSAVHDGGLCATARDVARFGQLLADDGRSRTGEQVLPRWWTRDVLAGAADAKDAFAATSSFETGMPGGHYRHQLWVPFPDGQVVLALGIHGQMVYVDHATGIVGVKLSTWPMPQSPARFHDTLNAFRAIAAHLVGGTSARPAVRLTTRSRHDCTTPQAAQYRRNPKLLPYQRRAHLLRRPDRVQPARARPLGSAFQLHHLLRRLGRRAPADDHPENRA